MFSFRTISIALLLCLSKTLTTTRNCPQGEVDSPQGCIVDCDSPKFNQCLGKVFPDIFNPKLCGWTGKQWLNETFECQICYKETMIGFKKGFCTGLESVEEGIAPSKIQRYSHPYNSYLPYERPSFPPKMISGSTLPCIYRPSDEECPTPQLSQQKQKNVCGMDTLGDLHEFSRGCLACKNQDIVSYWNSPCSQRKTDLINFLGKRINQYSSQCNKDEDCRYSWQICHEKSCQDSCVKIECSDRCLRGRCYEMRYRYT